MAELFSWGRARELAAAFHRHGVRYLFLGKSGAILLGYSDTTQDIDLYLDKTLANGAAAITALRDLGFPLTEDQAAELASGKDFVQIRNGPFDVDLVFAPDGIERFGDALARAVVVDGLPVCHPDDIIRSKEAANRVRDRESLPRLRAFRDWWTRRGGVTPALGGQPCC